MAMKNMKSLMKKLKILTYNVSKYTYETWLDNTKGAARYAEICEII